MFLIKNKVLLFSLEQEELQADGCGLVQSSVLCSWFSTWTPSCWVQTERDDSLHVRAAVLVVDRLQDVCLLMKNQSGLLEEVT